MSRTRLALPPRASATVVCVKLRQAPGPRKRARHEAPFRVPRLTPVPEPAQSSHIEHAPGVIRTRDLPLRRRSTVLASQPYHSPTDTGDSAGFGARAPRSYSGGLGGDSGGFRPTVGHNRRAPFGPRVPSRACCNVAPGCLLRDRLRCPSRSLGRAPLVNVRVPAERRGRMHLHRDRCRAMTIPRTTRCPPMS
jgi:hypothetical protein